jgi:hypothetical protein
MKRAEHIRHVNGLAPATILVGKNKSKVLCEDVNLI